MFFEQELKKHLLQQNKSFNSRDFSTILHLAIVDLKNRNVAGAFIVPLAYLVGGLMTDYASEHLFLFVFFGIILLTVTVLRGFVIVAFSKEKIKNTHVFLPLYFWSNLFTGLVWGLFAATGVLFYHNTPSVSLIVILLAGISGGSMASYCIWKLLSYCYLIIILVPTIFVEFYIGNSITIPIGISIIFFLIFNLTQARVWNDHYWLSLINGIVIENSTLELERLNKQLVVEISDHKSTSAKIAISRKKLRDIFNSAHDGILIFDLNGVVIDANITMEQIFKISREQALQFDVFKSMNTHKNIENDIHSIWQKTLQSNPQEFKYQEMLRDTNEMLTFQVNLRRSLWGTDSIVIATVRDITLQVEAMGAIVAANHAKSEFLANMSHELRTPMNGILGYARLGIKRFETLPRIKLNEYFEVIQNSGFRLMKLLDNVLDFSKLEVGKMQYNMRESDLLVRIHQVITELKPNAAEKGMNFVVESKGQKVSVYCDPEKIVQVLRNLLFNAIKFGDNNSEITIVSENIAPSAEEATQQISVTNNGIKIPDNELESIFEKFTQSSATKTNAGGTGLGLAISKQIVLDHNGKILAKNEPNGKITFCFCMPVNQQV
ncbi:MAG: PAS domain S-box protein [Desulfocapsa sp.]|nr:PAS domain S-box protein [Desulfocapsa sp.]